MRILRGKLHAKSKATVKLTLIAGRRSPTLLKPGCPYVNHLLLIQRWEMYCSASHSHMQDVRPASNPCKSSKGELLSWAGSLVFTTFGWEQPLLTGIASMYSRPCTADFKGYAYL